MLLQGWTERKVARLRHDRVGRWRPRSGRANCTDLGSNLRPWHHALDSTKSFPTVYRAEQRGALVARDLATGGGEWVRSCGVGTKTVKCQSSCKLLWMQALSTTGSSGQLEQLCGNFLGADSQVPRHSTFSSTKTSRIIFTTFSTKHAMPSTSRT